MNLSSEVGSRIRAKLSQLTGRYALRQIHSVFYHK